MTPALIFAATLMMGQPVTDNAGGELLPPGAPTDSYELAAWCYGALEEYLAIYDKVIPDLKDIDRMFGTSVVEDKPYNSDMTAARAELKLIATSVSDAEKASPDAIADRGLAALHRGQAIWSVAEGKSERELARAWLLWALPDRCDSNAKELTQRSLLFGRALNYNASSAAAPAPSAPAPTTDPTTTSDSIDGILSKGAAPSAAADAPAGSDAAPAGAAPAPDTPPAANAPAAVAPAADPPKARPYPY